MVSRTVGNTDDQIIGENAIREDPEGKGSKSTVVTVVDIVMNHPWRENQLYKRSLQAPQRLHEPNQRQTWRTETKKSKTFYDRG